MTWARLCGRVLGSGVCAVESSGVCTAESSGVCAAESSGVCAAESSGVSAAECSGARVSARPSARVGPAARQFLRPRLGYSFCTTRMGARLGLVVVHDLVGTRPRFGRDARIGCTRAKLMGMIEPCG